MSKLAIGLSNIKTRVCLLAIAVVLPLSPVSAKDKTRKPKGVEAELQMKAGDETGNEIKALKTEMLVIKSEKMALAQLNKLMRKYKGTPMEPDIHFRMAELYMRRARSERFFEIHKESDQVARFVPELVKKASEKKQIKNAISIYENIQKRFPRYHSMDVVIFNHAFARQQIGEDKAAEKLYFKIVTEFSHSPLVPDSHLAIGEINYDRRRFQFALEHFKMIRKYPEARAYPYGMYKAAWCYYNLQDAPSAMRELEQVVAFGHKMAEEQRDSRLDLRKEALNDLTIFFGDVFPASKAVGYFQKHALDMDVTPFIMRLSSLYKRHSRFADIEIILKDLIRAIPQSDKIASVYDELVWNYESMKKRPQAVAQLGEFSRYCETLPKSKNDKEPGQGLACRKSVADTGKKLATKWHMVWKKKQPVEAYADSAEKAYELYLRNVDKADTELNRVRYSFAELLFQRKKYREASVQYALVTVDPADKKLRHNSAYAAVYSLEKAVGNKWPEADEKRFVELADEYLKEFPKGEYALELEFKRAFIAYEKGRYDEAAPALQKIGWNYPPSDRVLKAQDLYLDILNLKKDYKSLKESARLLLKKGSDPKRATAIEKIYQEAYFAEIQSMEEKGESKPAVELYKKFAIENKSSPLASQAWWNASQLQFKISDHQGAADTCAKLPELFPASPNGKECLIQAARTLEAMAQLSEAADVLVRLASIDKPASAKWTELAADFYALSGSEHQTRRLYRKLIGESDEKQSLRLLEKWIELEKGFANQVSLKEVQDMLVKRNIEPYVSTRVLEQAETEFAKSNYPKAFETAKKIISKGGLPKNVLARARLIQAKILEDEFRRQSTKTRLERVAIVLALKTEKLEKAQHAYQSVIGYGDAATGVAALRNLAGCYLHYAQSVRSMDIGSDLPAAELEAFRSEIDNLAIPMEERGIESLNQALQAAKKFKVRDGTIAEIQDEINKMNMRETPVPASKIDTPPLYVPVFSGVGS